MDIKCDDTGEIAYNYDEYLFTDHWYRIKQAVRGYFDNHCAICASDYRLNVHHRHYKSLGNEQLKDLILLCKDCHEWLHQKAEERRARGYSNAVTIVTGEVLTILEPITKKTKREEN